MNNPNTENQSTRTLYSVTSWGVENKIYLERTEYACNDTLAVVATADDGEPYATLTVNLEDSDQWKGTEYQYVDINNCPWAPELLEKNGLATNTGILGFSGWCQYPLFKFNTDLIPVMPDYEEEEENN